MNLRLTLSPQAAQQLANALDLGTSAPAGLPETLRHASLIAGALGPDLAVQTRPFTTAGEGVPDVYHVLVELPSRVKLHLCETHLSTTSILDPPDHHDHCDRAMYLRATDPDGPPLGVCRWHPLPVPGNLTT